MEHTGPSDPFQLHDIIDHGLALDNQRRWFEASRMHQMSLSQIWRCQRDSWYDYSPHSSRPVTNWGPADPSSLMTWAIGHEVESLLVSVIRQGSAHLPTDEFRLITRMCELPGYESVNPDEQVVVSCMGVPGHVDGILMLPGRNFILEIKSMAFGAFGQAKRSGIQVSHPGYYSQVQSYMLGAQEALGLTIHGAAVVLVCKVGQQVNRRTGMRYVSRWVEWVEPDPDAVLPRIQLMSGVIKLTDPPPRPHTTPDNEQCQGCIFRDHCWGSDE